MALYEGGLLMMVAGGLSPILASNWYEIVDRISFCNVVNSYLYTIVTTIVYTLWNITYSVFARKN